jgi:thiamine-monophosphate kinase
MNEFELIQYLTKGFPIRHKEVIKSFGDDCSVWKEGNIYKVFTTDAMVEGDHFLKKWFSAYDVGNKAVESNLSDIASMGATPKFIYVSLIIDNKTNTSWISLLYDAIRDKCKEHNLTLMGGNITHGKTFSITISIEGETITKPILRNGAGVGDIVMVTDNIGEACIARISINKNLAKNKNIDKNLLKKLLHPRARLNEAQIIAKYATAMIDISDGIASETRHIAIQSNKGVLVNADSIPISEGSRDLAKKNSLDVLQAQLRGGEDYELLFTIPSDKINSFLKEYSKYNYVKVSQIGEIISENKYIYLKDNEEFELPKGFDHFSDNINL